jgi:hypothetical protein
MPRASFSLPRIRLSQTLLDEIECLHDGMLKGVAFRGRSLSVFGR